MVTQHEPTRNQAVMHGDFPPSSINFVPGARYAVNGVVLIKSFGGNKYNNRVQHVYYTSYEVLCRLNPLKHHR
jgi:hypothetical protein